MPGELVMDASVAVKCLIDEDDSRAALSIALSGVVVSVPAFINLELASVLTKKVRRGEIPQSVGADLLADAVNLFDQTFPDEPLVGRAFELAAGHGFSAYDGLYLALAEARDAQIVTADEKLIGRARAAGLASLVVGLK
jgi:predicted nucleic acid-binding protein